MLDLPIGGSLVPKEEIKKANLLKIEVRTKYIYLSGYRRVRCPQEHNPANKCMRAHRL